MKKDIENREDIILLVNSFYNKVREDPAIAHFFTEVMQVNWAQHLPKMYSFWETVLLGKASYKGNPLVKHIAIHQQEALLEKHFAQWLVLWQQTITGLFEGKTAESAKRKPELMKTLMLSKLHPVNLSLN